MNRNYLFFLSLFFCIQLNAQSDGILPNCVYTVSNVNVISGNGSDVLKNQDVTIYCGEITQISNHQNEEGADSVNGDIYVERGKTIDGTGKFLIPSYADAHVHLPEKSELENFFLMNLINGVTTLRSMRGEAWHLDIDQNNQLCPRLVLGSIPIEDNINFSIDSLTAFISEQKDLGFDFIKILGIDSASSFQNIVSISKSIGIALAGHCPRQVDLTKVAESNWYQSIEHLGGLAGYSSDEALIEAINTANAANLYHCATLSWTFALSQSSIQLRKKEGVSYISESMISEWEKNLKDLENQPEEQRALFRKRVLDYYKNQERLLSILYANGGKLLIGPDASDDYMIPGFDYHLELQKHSKLGLSNQDLIKAACYNLSEMLGETEEWGMIKEGSKTDLLLLTENPIKDIANAKKIEGIFLKGNYLTIEDLKEKL